jgi:hypothetical protein
MVKKKTEKPRPLPNDVVMLDDLIRKCYEQLLTQVATDAKLGDFLKMVEMRAKMAPSQSEQVKFWKMLDKVRVETLAEIEAAKRAAPRSKRQTMPRKGK